MQSNTAREFSDCSSLFCVTLACFYRQKGQLFSNKAISTMLHGDHPTALAVIVMMWRRWLDFADCRCPPSLFLSHVQSFDVIWPVAHHDANSACDRAASDPTAWHARIPQVHWSPFPSVCLASFCWARRGHCEEHCQGLHEG